MSKELKNQVLAFLKNPSKDKYDRFNKAFDFYKKSPNKSVSVETKLNRSGFTEDGLQNLMYDLQKLYDISDADVASKKGTDIAKEEFVEELNSSNLETQPEKSEIPGISQNSETVNSIEDLANKVLDHTEVPEAAPDDYKFLSGEELTPIRDEFPFLNEADCPEIMFVVVGKRISAYRRYQGLHAKLQDALANPGSVTDEEQAKLAADTQEANAENIALWDELKYYNEHKEILGKHPLFKESVAKKEVEVMTTEELAKFRTSSATFISKKKNALKAKGVTEEKKAELEQAIKDRQFKLSLVNAKLGIADGQK